MVTLASTLPLARLLWGVFATRVWVKMPKGQNTDGSKRRRVKTPRLQKYQYGNEIPLRLNNQEYSPLTPNSLATT